MHASGHDAYAIAKQLSSSDNQISCLLRKMGKSIQSVTKMTLDVLYPLGKVALYSEERTLAEEERTRTNINYKQARINHQAKQQQLTQQQQTQLLPIDPELLVENDWLGLASSDIRTFPDRLSVIPHSIFERLASAVPNLQELHLRGSCWDAALGTFGEYCSKLDLLEIDPLHVPVQVVKSLGILLPQLSTIAVGSMFLKDFDKRWAGAYIDHLLFETHHCRSLTSLLINTCHTSDLMVDPTSWSFLPASLQHMHYTCCIAESDQLTTLWKRLSSLSLWDPPMGDFRSIFFEYPLLRRLDLKTRDFLSLDCAQDAISSQHSLLRERLLEQSFQLSSYIMTLSGTCVDVQKTLAWLPAFPSVGLLAIEFEEGDPISPFNLQNVLFLFPNLKGLMLEGKVSVPENAGMQEQFLEPLKLLSKLGLLDILCTNLTLTSEGLLQLCGGMTNLESLNVRKDAGLNVREMTSRLQVLLGNAYMSVSF